ncbi:MAG: leucine-rich repeat domain-containing protein [Lachnospiraceae bacterium]|nr:leucine-rich repeat domain-containing protein [Lachnospiraceae bacterium]
MKTNIFTWEEMFIPSRQIKGIRITRIDPKEEYVMVPDMIDGLPVLELGPYVLEGSMIRELELPSGLERIGRYAFYNCEHLEKIRIPEGMKDIGSGAFTGAHRIKEISLLVPEENKKLVVLQEILMDVVEAVKINMLFPETEEVREIRLVFPAYYEEGVENTPARNITSEYYGTGLKFRNCIVGRQMQYEEYDKLFQLAASVEEPELVLEMALMRLLYPYKLKDVYREGYQNWIRQEAEEILPALIEEKRLDDLKFILEEIEIDSETRNKAAILCAEKGFAAAVSLFMDKETKETVSDSEVLSDEMQTTGPVVQSIFDLDEI